LCGYAPKKGWVFTIGVTKGRNKNNISLQEVPNLRHHFYNILSCLIGDYWVFQAYKLSSKPSLRLDRKGRVETRGKKTSNKKVKEENMLQLENNMEKIVS
jgi:hypothetical protein